MKKSNIKNYILSTIYFILLFILKLISFTYTKNLSEMQCYKYYDLVMLFACVIFIILGIIIGTLANRTTLSKTEKMLDSIFIGLPSFLLMLSGFLFIKMQSFIPEFFKGNNIVFIFGGAIMFGSIVQTAIKVHNKTKKIH